MKHLDFVLFDILAICLSLYLAYGFRHGFGSRFAVVEYVNIGLVMVVLNLGVTLIRDCFQDVIRRGYLREFGNTIVQFSMVMVGVLVYLYFAKKTIMYSRIAMAITWVLGILIMYLFRIIHKLQVRKRLQREDRQSSVLLVCSRDELKQTMDDLMGRKYRDYRVCGILLTEEPAIDGKPAEAEACPENISAAGQSAGTDQGAGKAEQPSETYRGIPILQDMESVTEYAKTHVIDEMFINLPQKSEQAVSITADALAMGMVVHQNLLGSSKTSGDRIVDDFAGYMVLTSGIRLSRRTDVVIKRLMDIAGAVVGLFITALAFPVVAIAIKRKSPGPVIFSQIRIGKSGRRFRLYKFRSMMVDAEEQKASLEKDNMMSGNMFKIHNDPRVIPGVGDFIRRSSIDELPQFWNVLKGDMSLVGTRPPTVEEYERYDMHHLARMSIKPGITGLWQVSGRNKITDFEEVVRLDKKYIEEWSLYLDLKILARTVQVVFLGDGE